MTKNKNRATLPTDAKERKKFPMASGLLDYFPDALAAIANLSYQGNEQHNSGQPLHWAREKSKDHADTLLRHFAERGTVDNDGQRHSTKVAWRALAILQLEIEQELSSNISQKAQTQSLINRRTGQKERRRLMTMDEVNNSPMRRDSYRDRREKGRHSYVLGQ